MNNDVFIENYIDDIKKQFLYYKSLGEKTFGQLSEKEILHQYNSESNSIAIIVNHLWGNMMSRWTDFLITDGEKTWRDRDSEFEDVVKFKSQLLKKWEEGWDCLFSALDSINEKNFETEVLIRNQKHSIIEAINRQLGHYAYHVGQIVFLGKLIKSKNWKTLSIAKGKHSGHFSEDLE